MVREEQTAEQEAEPLEHRRTVRSFVVRGGRTTTAQERALRELWPIHGLEFGQAPLDLDACFRRRAPRVLEIGFGNGENLAALAAAHPEEDFLGIEVHRPGVGRLLLECEARRLANVRVICHDAVEVLQHQLMPGSFVEALILFPDPWHKKRHHKRRLIQPDFVTLLASRLAPRGLLRLATDWQPYAEQMLEVLSRCELLENAIPGGGFAPRWSERASTRFERRGQRLGHEVRELVFQRRDGS